MAGATWRYDFYVDSKGELIKRKAQRPKGNGPWPRRDPAAGWSVSIEHHNGIKSTRGPRWTPQREAEAIVRTVYPTSTTNDLGARVPQRVQEAFTRKFESIVDSVTRTCGRRWRELHTENAMVGVLVGALDAVSIDVDGWSISVDAQTFSDKVKEPLVGADLGWRIEVREGAEETVKGILMQAKKADHIDGWQRLPDLASQMEDMSKVTDERYGLIFTPNGIVTASDRTTLPLVTTIADAVRCERGDQSPLAVANTLDAKHVVLVDVEGPADEE